MKKIVHSKYNNRYIGLAALVIILGIAIYWLDRSNSPAPDTTSSAPATTRKVNSIDYSPATKADNSANENRKDTSAPVSSTLNNNSNASNSTTVSVTSAGKIGSNFHVGTVVSGTSSGTCTLNIAQQGQTTISKTSSVQLQGSSYSCGSFNVPLSQFPNQGEWNVSVILSSESSTSTGDWSNNPVDLSE